MTKIQQCWNQRSDVYFCALLLLEVLRSTSLPNARAQEKFWRCAIPEYYLQLASRKRAPAGSLLSPQARGFEPVRPVRVTFLSVSIVP